MSLIFVFLVGFLEIIGQTCSFSNASITAGPEAIVISNGNKSDGLIPGSPYAYEAWTDAFPPSGVIPEGKVPANFELTIYVNDTNGDPTAAFRAEWNESSDFLARTGLRLDTIGKKYDHFNNIIAEYAYDRIPYTCEPIENQTNKCVHNGAAGDYSYIGVYGWTRYPLVEYYIVDDWFGNPYDQVKGDSVNVGEGTICWDYLSETPPRSCKVGTFTVDGSVYNVFKHHRTNAFSIDGVSDFDQYYSLRQDPRKCGTISVTEHFKAWESLGLELGELYEAQLLVEAGGGIGWIDYTHAAVKTNIPDKCAPYGQSDDHYQLPGGGVGPCTLRACTDRKKNVFYATQPCGPGDCYWDQGATNNLLKCIEKTTTCSNSDHYEQKDDSRSCVLKACADRTKNDLNPNKPCGPDDCYWDQGATDNLLKCIESATPCTNSDLYEKKDETNSCVLKPQDPEPAGSSIAVVNVALLLLAVFWLTFG